jgi:hypothetical protein
LKKGQILTIEGQTKLVIFGRNKLKYRVGLKQTLLCETLVNIEGKQTNKSKNTEAYTRLRKPKSYCLKIIYC